MIEAQEPLTLTLLLKGQCMKIFFAQLPLVELVWVFVLIAISLFGAQSGQIRRLYRYIRVIFLPDIVAFSTCGRWHWH